MVNTNEDQRPSRAVHQETKAPARETTHVMLLQPNKDLIACEASGLEAPRDSASKSKSPDRYVFHTPLSSSGTSGGSKRLAGSQSDPSNDSKRPRLRGGLPEALGQLQTPCLAPPKVLHPSASGVSRTAPHEVTQFVRSAAGLLRGCFGPFLNRCEPHDASSGWRVPHLLGGR